MCESHTHTQCVGSLTWYNAIASLALWFARVQRLSVRIGFIPKVVPNGTSGVFLVN